MSKSASDKWNDGLKVVEAVYGPGSASLMDGQEGSPFVAEIVGHQFGDVWADPALSIRDKRLLVLGATAMLGRADLIEIQMAGALANDEFTVEQLQQIPLFMLFYAGAGNTTALFRGIEAARAKARAKQAGAQEANGVKPGQSKAAG
jgi:4-carboxymuconolactone decarboxylase